MAGKKADMQEERPSRGKPKVMLSERCRGETRRMCHMKCMEKRLMALIAFVALALASTGRS